MCGARALAFVFVLASALGGAHFAGAGCVYIFVCVYTHADDDNCSGQPTKTTSETPKRIHQAPSAGQSAACLPVFRGCPLAREQQLLKRLRAGESELRARARAAKVARSGRIRISFVAAPPAASSQPVSQSRRRHSEWGLIWPPRLALTWALRVSRGRSFTLPIDHRQRPRERAS